MERTGIWLKILRKCSSQSSYSFGLIAVVDFLKIIVCRKNCVPRSGGLHYLSLEVLCIEEGLVVGELDQLVHLFRGFVNNGQMQIPGVEEKEKMLLKK